jgi:hypothetical protein
MQRAHQINRNRPRCRFAFFRRLVLAQLAHVHGTIRILGNMARQKDQVAGLDIHDIRRSRRGRRGQGDVQGLEFFGDRHGIPGASSIEPPLYDLPAALPTAPQRHQRRFYVLKTYAERLLLNNWGQSRIILHYPLSNLVMHLISAPKYVPNGFCPTIRVRVRLFSNSRSCSTNRL